MPNKNKSCHNRDIFSRMNFLYQASVMMGGKNNVLSSYYGSLCKSVGKRAVLRMDPSIKRTLCKRCNLALKPGVTADINIEESNENILEITCKKCNFKRNFINNSDYKLWIENPKCVVETFGLSDELEEKANSLSLKIENNSIK